MTSGFRKCGIAAAACLFFGAYDHPAIGAAAPPPTQRSPQQAYANFLPPLESIALPSEQAVLNRFAQKAAGPGADPATVLAAADEALASLGSPTKLRGFIQFARAGALAALNRELDAVDAADESVRLLPGYSAPLITAFNINAYLSRTGEAADYLMRAMEVDPTTVRTVDDYEIDNLMRRLDGYHDEARVRALSDRLLQIGWIGKRLGSRSKLATDAIKRHIADGDVAGAKALIPKLLVPSDSRSLLVMNAYSGIWPDVEAWAGSRLERQWPIYLKEARDRWAASRTAVATRDYLSALEDARQYEVAVRDILPLIDQSRKNDWELVFVISPLAKAMAKLGRWEEANALFERAQRIWPLGSNANALNIAANHAVLLLRAGRAKEGLERIDASLADARRWGPEVGLGALAAMQHHRACLLHELGRDSEAAVSVAQALAVERGQQAALLHLCMGNREAAKKALLDGLANEATRGGVVEFVQLSDEDPYPSAYGQKLRAEIDALRSDLEILKVVAKYGRVLPWRLNEAAASPTP